jgi:hypothetical protein
MNILGNLGPEDSDLIYLVTQPLIAKFYVTENIFLKLRPNSHFRNRMIFLSLTITMLVINSVLQMLVSTVLFIPMW